MIEEYKGLETSKGKLSKEVSALETSKMSVVMIPTMSSTRQTLINIFRMSPTYLFGRDTVNISVSPTVLHKE